MAGPQQPHGDSMARDAKTQTQTQTQKEEDLSAGAEQPVNDTPTRPPLVLEPSPPDNPPEAPLRERPEDLQALWNAEAHPCLPRWKEMSDTRKRKAASRLRERPLAEWREVIRRINASAFCRGEQGDWRASPDWILQTDTAAKVLEGKYLKAGEAPAQPAEAPKRRVITM